MLKKKCYFLSLSSPWLVLMEMLSSTKIRPAGRPVRLKAARRNEGLTRTHNRPSRPFQFFIPDVDASLDVRHLNGAWLFPGQTKVARVPTARQTGLSGPKSEYPVKCRLRHVDASYP